MMCSDGIKKEISDMKPVNKSFDTSIYMIIAKCYIVIKNGRIMLLIMPFDKFL